ncbi:Gfo/Idh/MocA family protein [Pelagimonas varians]|uniref:1,5-anhydro-D-fructose reductase n=2 Tax=Pelagimonas varians TaxID=696760 RepID=A0A238KUT7_9RHOB|nr:Gfo/Idh/MocA family oxidoreductase [Pelagimonas varians]PYG28296.1 putative dehydrogenase [Pelagimonas varians]SMX46410.1 1,5-anhydro-D-fructose reductase [Pelagimonas varians]
MTAAIPLCVIGAGQIGMRHIEVAQALPSVDLTGVVEPDPSRRATLVAQGLPVVAQIADLPLHTKAAVIATPTPQHFSAARAAFERGLAVLVEKPTGATLNEARMLIDQAKSLGLPLFTGHHRRCHPFSSAARDILPKIGQPIGVQGFWSLRKHDTYYDVPWRCAPGAGPLMTNLSHEIDLLRFLFGDIVETSAFLSHAARNLQIEDTATLNLRFSSGSLGSFLISDAGASPWAFEAACGENPDLAVSGQDYIRATGTQGALAFPSLTLWQGSDGTATDWKHPLVRVKGAEFAAIDPLQEQMRRFAAVVDGGEDNILCSGDDGLAALEISLAATLSGQTGMPVRTGSVPGDYTGA